ncbi:MAG: hypothetical protein ACK4OM_02285 [Alphaproteobacteria bacterium]
MDDRFYKLFNSIFLPITPNESSTIWYKMHGFYNRNLSIKGFNTPEYCNSDNKSLSPKLALFIKLVSEKFLPSLKILINKYKHSEPEAFDSGFTYNIIYSLAAKISEEDYNNVICNEQKVKDALIFLEDFSLIYKYSKNKFNLISKDPIQSLSQVTGVPIEICEHIVSYIINTPTENVKHLNAAMIYHKEEQPEQAHPVSKFLDRYKKSKSQITTSINL